MWLALIRLGAKARHTSIQKSLSEDSPFMPAGMAHGLYGQSIDAQESSVGSEDYRWPANPDPEQRPITWTLMFEQFRSRPFPAAGPYHRSNRWMDACSRMVDARMVDGSTFAEAVRPVVNCRQLWS